MKKSYIIPKTNNSKIPYSKTSFNKVSLELSNQFNKNIKGRIKNDSIKDTFDGSIAESGTYTSALNPENLKNSKLNRLKGYSFDKIDNNNNIFTYSLNNAINQRNKSTIFSKEHLGRTEEENSENIVSSEDNGFKSSEKKSLYNEEDDDTNRIDFRYYPKIPEIEGNVDKNKQLYWLATYDKLMKKSKIIKILSYYSDSFSHKDTEIFVIEDAQSDYKEEENKERLRHLNEKYKFKEKTMVIQGYEIYFVKKHGKPFVRQKIGGKIFIKLYLFSLEQINQIFSYINRLEYKKYINNLNSFKQRNTFRIINNFNKTIYNYTKIFCLGTFMNTNIYMFSHSSKNREADNGNNDSYSANYLVNNLPSSNKIAKIIKVLMINFPEFTKQYFIDYLMKPHIHSINFNNHDLELIKQKMKEVNSLLITGNKNELKTKNNNNTNNIIKRTIRAIPTNTLSSKENTNDLNNINYINNDGNCSDFLSNIKNELDGLVSYPKKIIKNKIENNNKIYKSKTNKIKPNNTILTRNNKNVFDKINNNDFHMKSNYENQICQKQNICRTISLLNPIKKSLTRNASKNGLTYDIKKNIDKEKERLNNNIIKIDKKSLHRNKGNDLNILNKYNTENNNYIYCNKTQKLNEISNELTNFCSQNNLNLNLIKNKNIQSSYYTHNNTLEKNYYSQTNQKTYNAKKPTRVISTVEKIIPKKISQLTPNSTSFSKLNKNNSSTSFRLLQNNRYGIEVSNNLMKTKKQKLINSRINNNSLNNKVSDFITPLKKKYFYYYH